MSPGAGAGGITNVGGAARAPPKPLNVSKAGEEVIGVEGPAVVDVVAEDADVDAAAVGFEAVVVVVVVDMMRFYGITILRFETFYLHTHGLWFIRTL